MNQEQFEKELKMKDEEYEILRVTSEQIEEEQRREIYELQQRINKAIELLGNYKHYSVPEEAQNKENEEVVDNALKVLKDEEDIEVKE